MMPRWLWLWAPIAIAVLLAVTARLFPQIYIDYLVPEVGVLETVQVLEGLVAAGVAAGLLITMRRAKHPRWLWTFVGLVFLGSVYIAGEEASWGQHFVGWTTPERWAALNEQGETNLHNLTSWLNMKPRALLELAAVIGTVVLVPLQGRVPALRTGVWGVLIPPRECIPAALLVVLTKVSEGVAEQIPQVGWTVFYRASEVGETFLYLFVIFYLIGLTARIRAGEWRQV